MLKTVLLPAIAACLLVTMPSLAPMALAATDVEVHAQIEQVLGNADQLDEPMLSITEAIKNGDPAAIAEYTEFPLGNTGEDVTDAADLADRFDEIFTEEVKAALADFQYTDLIVNSEGVGLGNGAIWINLFCDDDACSKSHWALARVNN